MNQWYKIDNAGKMFHAVSEQANSSVFRISMIMTSDVNATHLQRALDDVMKRLPMFAVKLGKGLFWDFLVENDQKLLVQREKRYPCAPIDPIETNGYLLRVVYYNKRLAVEFFHSMTDGTGALEFIKALVYYYLIHSGETVEHDGTLLDIEDEPSHYEIDDSYQNYVTKDKGKKPKETHAYQIRGEHIEETIVVHGKLCASDVHQLAKSYGTTVTAFLTAVMIHAIYKEKLNYRFRKEEIKIAIPVNLRSFFPSKTLRNFFAVVNVGMRVHDRMTIEEIIEGITSQLQSKARKESLQQSLNHHVQWQTMLAARFIPIFLKYHAIRYGYKSYGERTKSMTLTNIGRIELPKSMQKYVEHMEMVMYPTRKSPINGGMVAIKDELVISFARTIKEADLIRAFFQELTQTHNLNVHVYSNDGR
ncbi:alcohol acetyltransferase [Geomicrobium sp. JCM 19038]|uniref:alcohol acetyltransferase n=1 Tax=Geomicrobium sp. JCM 19038 TaxID=1460635 RepID=UPI00045F1092|nr:alcohol acetyltransferase [Geomicrobium sp. JCM 19038]GAK08661.1 hypothetical protein JCM19038_2450 [Geomicrobium sp. JCM 19038]